MKTLWCGWFVALFAGCASRQPLGDSMGESLPADKEMSSGEDGHLSLGEPMFEAEAATKAGALAPAPTPAPPDASGAERQVVYSAALRLVVVSAREALASIQSFAKEAGGHLQESDARSITIRVPAERFEAVVARIAALGEVLENNVRAADVTEEMLDLGIRLENLRKARERLLEHLAKSDKLEDTLKIEQELTRVTGEIEQLEGRLRYMQAQIAMSTIRVELNMSAPERAHDGLEIPFEWVARLGDGLLAGTVQGSPRKPHIFSSGPDFTPPADFVRYYSKSDLVEALNAEGVRIKVQRQDNYDEGALVFWRQLARSTLVRTRALAVEDERELDAARWLLRGTRDVGGEPSGYLLVLVREKKRVYTFEAWGPKDAFERSAAALVESAKSLEK